jgi:hypothetical protein
MIKFNIYQDVIDRMYYATLLGGEFSNTYGQGETPDQAVTSLKIRVYQLRRKENEI